MELVRHVQSECNVWFKANSTPSDIIPQQPHDTQALCLQSIFMVNGYWTVESHYNGYGGMKLESINSWG